MSKGAYRKLGWGLLLTVIDIRIAQLDIIPDFVGYILIAAALRTLSTEQEAFRRASWIAIPMIFLSMPDLILPAVSAFIDIAAIPMKLHLYFQSMQALRLLMVYWIFQGMYASARELRAFKLLNSIYNRRLLYLLVNVTLMAGYPFLFNMEDSMELALIAAGVLAFILELLFIRLAFRMAKAEHQKPSGPGQTIDIRLLPHEGDTTHG
ncbi:hypothetical protein ACFO9Q_03965 [Paenibacillus sp. GCM10023252]|uniref:hypothetical protein n=1 Tax=Paenibacillus sp. GCM10023252 TaxID=3252649 RepID=UPI00361A2CF5